MQNEATTEGSMDKYYNSDYEYKTAERSPVPLSQNDLAVNFTRAQFEQLSTQRQLLNEFVASQFIPGVDVMTMRDKQCLLKGGAEKLRKLFGLGSRIISQRHELDPERGWVWFTYRVEVYDLRTGTAISDCEGSANSLEKARVNNNWADVLNTVQKMAQKRAFVGAVISATGASDFFTQDLEDMDLTPQQTAPTPTSDLPLPHTSSGPVQNFGAPDVSTLHAPSFGVPLASTGTYMATDKQQKMLWAKLNNELNLKDQPSKAAFLFNAVGKNDLSFLTFADVDKVVQAINKAKAK